MRSGSTKTTHVVVLCMVEYYSLGRGKTTNSTEISFFCGDFKKILTGRCKPLRETGTFPYTSFTLRRPFL